MSEAEYQESMNNQAEYELNQFAEIEHDAACWQRLKAMKVDEEFEASLVANYCVDSDGITKEYIRNKGGINILECAKFAVDYAIKLAESQESEGGNG